jgi:hypothetical protein
VNVAGDEDVAALSACAAPWNVAGGMAASPANKLVSRKTRKPCGDFMAGLKAWRKGFGVHRRRPVKRMCKTPPGILIEKSHAAARSAAANQGREIKIAR